MEVLYSIANMNAYNASVLSYTPSSLLINGCWLSSSLPEPSFASSSPKTISRAMVKAAPKAKDPDTMRARRCSVCVRKVPVGTVSWRLRVLLVAKM